MRRPTRVITTLCLSLIGTSAFAAEPFFRGIGFVPGGNTVSGSGGISGDGTLAVGYTSTSNGTEGYRYFVIDDVLEPLGPAAFGSSIAWDASFDGSVIGGQTTCAALWTESDLWVSLGQLPGNGNEWAMGVSADGSVLVGESNSEAFRWTEETGMVGIGYLDPIYDDSAATSVSADGTIIVGFADTSIGERAFAWTESTGMVELLPEDPNSEISLALDISANGEVIVGRAGGSNLYEAVYWIDGEITPLGYLYPDHERSFASAVSADGAVIVGASRSDDEDRAFLWTAQTGMVDLEVYLETEFELDLDDWVLEFADGISDDGYTITGSGINPAGQQETWVAYIGVAFERGNCNGIGIIDLPDAIYLLNFLFAGAVSPPCLDACDIDDSGSFSLGDPVALLDYLFLSGPPLPAPFLECGPDPTTDSFDCESFDPCD